MMTKHALAKEVIEEVRNLAAPQLRELRMYVYFLKARRAIDPTQLYFWTQQWQAWEREAGADKRAGHIVGDGTLRGLLTALKRRCGWSRKRWMIFDTSFPKAFFV